MTYPNVLVMDYLKKTKQIKPELQMKCEGYINAGYQQLLTYEVAGGGFSWFGQAPAHKVLTAYGIILFGDMAKVHNVDPNIVARTQNWLASLQRADGSWEVDQGGIAEGIINRQTDALRVTAYVMWALAETGFQGAQLQKAVNYVQTRMSGVDDAYTMAVIANAFTSMDKDSAAAQRACERLAGMATQDAKTAHWTSKATPTGAQGESADIETTGLAAYALLKGRRQATLTNKALTYLVQHKDPYGTWGSTQATVWALRALVYATEHGAEETNGEVTVRINDQQAGAFAVTPKDADVMRQVELKDHVREGENQIAVRFSGKGSLMYAISAKYYLKWGVIDVGEAQPLDIVVDYDRTELAVNDTVTCRVRVTNRKPLAANMVIVDLGIPPGFEVQAGDLEELVGSRKITKFSLTGRQVIVYLDLVKAGETVAFECRLKAKFPLKAKTPKSAAYEYYTPKVRAEAHPVEMVVKG